MVRIIKLIGNAESPLLVSAGKAGSIIEPLAIKTANGKLVYVIPSTSWRGVFRAMSLRIVSHVFGQDSVEGFAFVNHHYKDLKELNEKELRDIADYILNNVSSNIYGEIDKASLVARGEKIEELLEEDLREAVDIILSMTCPLERLYGSNYAASKVIFFDTYIDRSVLRYVTHVGIDRKTGIKREKALYTEGALVPRDDVKIVIIDHTLPETPERKLLEETLNVVKLLGLHIGFAKSRGLGVISIKNINIEEIK